MLFFRRKPAVELLDIARVDPEGPVFPTQPPDTGEAAPVEDAAHELRDVAPLGRMHVEGRRRDEAEAPIIVGISVQERARETERFRAFEHTRQERSAYSLSLMPRKDGERSHVQFFMNPIPVGNEGDGAIPGAHDPLPGNVARRKHFLGDQREISQEQRTRAKSVNDQMLVASGLVQIPKGLAHKIFGGAEILGAFGPIYNVVYQDVFPQGKGTPLPI